MARPSKPLISRSGAAQAALDVIDEHGLEELSLGLVAKKLGVRPPSLYHHFKDKSELLQEVARIMLVRMPVIAATGQSFEEQIIARCVATRQTLLQHTNAAPLILRYFPRHMLLAAYDRATSEEPYPTAIQMTVLDAVEKYTYGAALFEASARARGIDPMPPVDSEKYPSLAQAVADNPFDDEQLFVESLRLFLAGVRERIRTGSIGQPLE
ncbi:TetR/AcrR family transcriptional regulator [Sphingopyxis witflariensis]|uniref:TetR family transcriptional regulator n=1 Tax=Sphingopyxis witflariensis TaxID=173675 RepID=A0A246JKV5_9SPHN|nr:TetR family transcriptional regulator [Sphingopyxis witflariensis]OWQ92839.1 TetR family transcriptional regulator [Sphingopyxis witflariensis]